MKKLKVLILVFIICLLVGCTKESNKSKEVRSMIDFEEASSNIGYSVVDNIDSYMGVDYITDSKKVEFGNTSVEMVVYTDIESAKKVQEEQINTFRKFKNTATTENKEKGTNYYKFWMVSNGYYMVSSRVDNTLVFCKTELKNKENVEKILSDLNY